MLCRRRTLLLLLACAITGQGAAQTPPNAAELAAYRGLFAAVAAGDDSLLEQQLAAGSRADRRDPRGRTPLIVAAHLGRHGAMRLLAAAGADPNALDSDAYDIVTIAAVANDLATLELALKLGCRPGNITSPYAGTALIAAAHLGHAEIVRTLIAAGAPLDHVNNLGWTALIESIVLGDGGERHIATLRALVEAGAAIDLADSSGRTPLQLASERNYAEMARILRQAGAR